jgi:hypothetical protein
VLVMSGMLEQSRVCGLKKVAKNKKLGEK